MFDKKPYAILTRIQELEYKQKQLESDIKVLQEIVKKIRPKYYKLQSPIIPSATPGIAGP